MIRTLFVKEWLIFWRIQDAFRIFEENPQHRSPYAPHIAPPLCHWCENTSREALRRMEGSVLLLNADYSVLGLCSLERAIVLMVLDKVDVVHPHPGRELRSPRRTYPIPSIVRLRGFVRIPYRQVMLTRKNVFRRDGYRCQYCGGREHLTIDHVLPRSRGGVDSWENLATACTRCNAKKGNRTPLEAGMPLTQPPTRPSPFTFLRDHMGALDEAWKPYLFLA